MNEKLSLIFRINYRLDRSFSCLLFLILPVFPKRKILHLIAEFSPNQPSFFSENFILWFSPKRAKDFLISRLLQWPQNKIPVSFFTLFPKHAVSFQFDLNANCFTGSEEPAFWRVALGNTSSSRGITKHTFDLNFPHHKHRPCCDNIFVSRSYLLQSPRLPLNV